MNRFSSKTAVIYFSLQLYIFPLSNKKTREVQSKTIQVLSNISAGACPQSPSSFHLHCTHATPYKKNPGYRLQLI